MAFISRVLPEINNRRTEQHIELRASLLEMLTDYEWTHLVTLNPNHNYKLVTMQAKVRRFDNNITQRLFKQKIWTQEAWLWFGFVEYTAAQKPHYHLIIRVIPKRAQWFREVAPSMWIKQAPHGSIDIQAITHNQNRVIEYVTKLLDRPDPYNHFMVSKNLQNRPCSGSLINQEKQHD